jgi:probable addiction module antidote protein
MALKTRPWDAAEHLDTPEAVAAYLEAALEDGDPHLISAAIGDVARARGMSTLSKETGLSRESLYRSLSAEGNPELGTVLKVMGTWGVRFEVKPAAIIHQTHGYTRTKSEGKSVTTKHGGLDNRHRDKSGEIQQKRSDTLNKNLSKLIPQFSPNTTLGAMRKKTGKVSEESVRRAAKKLDK